MEKVISPDFSVGALGMFERPAFANQYAVAGRFISVAANDREFTDLFHRYFTDWHMDALSGAEHIQPDVTIRVIPTNDPPSGPADLESFEVADGGICRTDAQNYFFENYGSSVRADNDRPSYVELWLGESPAARERAPLARVIFNASMAAMRRCGLFELHAAGVVAKTGGGVLIIGPSGSGKSTLATQLAVAGWQYLSDDSLLLYRNGEWIEARALRRVFALKEETFSVSGIGSPDSFSTQTIAVDPYKLRFEPRAVFPDNFAGECVPRTLLFSRITDEAKSQTKALSHGESMKQLIRMCPWACYDRPAAAAHLDVLGRLARQAKAYELFAGRDLIGDPEYAGHFLLALTQ